MKKLFIVLAILISVLEFGNSESKTENKFLAGKNYLQKGINSGDYLCLVSFFTGENGTFFIGSEDGEDSESFNFTYCENIESKTLTLTIEDEGDIFGGKFSENELWLEFETKNEYLHLSRVPEKKAVSSFQSYQKKIVSVYDLPELINNLKNDSYITCVGHINDDLYDKITNSLRNQQNVKVFLDFSMASFPHNDMSRFFSSNKTSRTFHDSNCLIGIIIPEGTTKIGMWAFYGCKSLISVTIPESVTEISTQAFDGCSELKEITIPKNVKCISKWAFSGTNIKSITLPADCDTYESFEAGTKINYK